MKSNKTSNKKKSSEESTSSDSDRPNDDGYPWFGCVCGNCHETFWIQCDTCNAWYNVSHQCLGNTNAEADWKCHDCCLSHEEYDSSDDEQTIPQCKLDKHEINREETDIPSHPIYSSDLEQLDNTELCKPKCVLTERSVAVCSRLIAYFLLRENQRSDFRKDVWPYIWYCLRYEQKMNGWELGWNSYSATNKSRKKYYYIPKKSPHSNTQVGVDCFSSPEGVVAFICDVIQNVDANAFDCFGDDDIKLFQTNLRSADENNTIYCNVMKRNGLPSKGKKRPLNQVNKNQYKKKRQRQMHNTNEVEIVRLTQDLLNAIAASDHNKIASLCAKDTISFKQQQIGFDEEKGGLVQGLPTVGSSTMSNKQDGNKIFLTGQWVEFQGEYNDVAVISYTRHDVNSSFDQTTRNEVRVWTKKSDSWINTFTCTLPLSSVRL
jgi:hypothetical protein